MKENINHSARLLRYEANFGSLEQDAKGRADILKNIKMDDPVSAYGKKLKAEGDLDQADTRFIDLQIDAEEKYYVLTSHTKTDSDDIIVELHQLLDGKEYKFDNKNIGLSTYADARDWTIRAAKIFQDFNTNTILNKPGFCVDGGIFVDGGKSEANESFTVVVSFPDHPDIQFSIDANAIDKVNTGELLLKHRVDADLNMMRSQYSGIDVIERGALQVASQQGYQIAIGAPYDNVHGTRIRKFFWSDDGVPNDVTRPFMEIDMTVQPTDDGKSTIKDDAEARALWEQLIHSLRIRPGAV